MMSTVVNLHSIRGTLEHAGVYPPGLRDALARLLSAGSSTMETEGVDEEVDT